MRRTKIVSDFQKTQPKYLDIFSVSCAGIEMEQKRVETGGTYSRKSRFDKLLHQIRIKRSEF